MGSLYTRAGAEIRYHRGLIVNDLRYMVVDGKLVVIGLRKSLERESPQARLRHSIRHGQSFQDHFERYWKSPEALPYEVYVKELSVEITRMNVGISRTLCRDNCGYPMKEARSYAI
jgi:hypothetical protein